MKIFVATDLHGSAFWAEKTVQEFRRTGADLLVLLGDVYNHGPRNPFPAEYAPMRVAEILNGIADKLLVIRGNCDSEVDQMISRFTFVENNMLIVGGRRLFFTHGHVYNKTNLPSLSKGDVLLYGHFHVNEIVSANGVTCVNVGSCALPKDGASSYCLIDETTVKLLSFGGEVICEKAL